MTFPRPESTGRTVLLALLAFGIMTAVLILPSYFKSEAGSIKTGSGLFPKTVSHDGAIPNYDIRSDKSSMDKIAGFRNSVSRNAAEIADVRDGFVRGEERLRSSISSLKIEYSHEMRAPEVIAPRATLGRKMLTEGAAGLDRPDVLKSFLSENTELVGAERSQIDSLKVTADYTNPDGNLSFVTLEQEIGGISVFRGEVKAGFSRNGEIVRVINNLAPGLDYSSLSSDFADPSAAVRAAAGYINHEFRSGGLERNTSESSEHKAVFGSGDSATTAEKMYFPTEPGVAVPAWRVLIWEPVNAYYVIVDAQTGTMLWRKNITEDQTQAATYDVYANGNAMINVADNPFPFTPGPTAPNGAQGAAIARTSITRVGNEAPYNFNVNGWINDGGDRTDGNALQAGLDRDGSDGVDFNGEAVNAGRNFTYAYNPYNPNTNTGEPPVAVPQTYPGSAFQQGSTTQLFYITNWYHDELYRLGFTEEARNFQHLNFGRGGAENDRIRAEGQDSSGTNNANFSTPADGGRGRMQMYIWTAPNPDIDGNLDADVVIHEITHGTSNRLHGNSSGLVSNMSRGMGEGWGDFYGNCLLSEPSDTAGGIYTTGGYDLYLSGGGVNNYYYGIRRFPKAIMSSTGGPNNRPHNPLTFADIDGSQMNLSDGAYAPRGGGAADQVHNAGEVWGIALWEARAKLIARQGWAIGNRKILQYVTDGMKLAPLGPTFLQERDAIIAAAQASLPPAQANPDVADIWAGFAIRGMGFSAVVVNPGTGTGNARVIEGFDLPNLIQTGALTISDTTGNGNGFPEPGETITLNVPLFNNTGVHATGVTVQITGGGAATSYGTINNNTTGTGQISFTVPAGTPCGSSLTLTFTVNSSLGTTTFTRMLIVGVPTTTFSENFDSVSAPNLPTGWTTTQTGVGTPFVTATNLPDSAPNSAFTPNPSAVGGASLNSPVIPITAAAGLVTFRNNYNSEDAWDGGVLEISINGGSFIDILAAGGRFLEGGYNGTLGVVAGNPVSGRAAWTGNSGGYITTRAQLPASAAGQNVQLRWLFGSDTNTFSVGWHIDSVIVAGTYTCGPVVPNVKSRADFDGDGKTDVSVFRPSEGNWYLNRSTAGFTGINWGVSSDILTPGDFDGDNKADTAVFRNGTWYILGSASGFRSASWGSAGDIPQVGDYNGDGTADIAVFRPSESGWYVLLTNGGSFSMVFGTGGDVPVRGDYNGDGATDIAIYRGGQWWIYSIGSGAVTSFNFGIASDKPVPADYDGDSKDDVAVYRPSDGTWYILRSSNGSVDFVPFGISTDVPVPGDYDGDGKDDQAVYRDGMWWLNRSTAGLAAVPFGLSSDIPIPAKYIP